MNVIRSLRLASIASLLVLLFTTVAQAQTVTVTGTVKDTTGEPVIGATVAVVGVPGKGATADLDGNFTITAVPSDATLRISFVGMKTQEIALQGRTHIDVVLHEDSELLDEVVVVGYGTQKKANLTGAVSTVDGKTLEAKPISNIGQGLQGVVPNLQVTMGNGGAPGAHSNFNIRGTTSLNGGGPLVLVDNVQMDPNLINPDDVESISVLKDAASASIYGARAAYGVILITTKKGRKGERPTISANVTGYWQKPAMEFHNVNSMDFLKMKDLGNQNDGGQMHYYKENVYDYAKRYFEGSYPDPVFEDKSQEQPYKYVYCGNTDWWNELYKTSFSNIITTNINGGTDKTTYYASVGLNNQSGVLRGADDHHRRMNASVSVSSQLNKWLNASMRISDSYTDERHPTGGVTRSGSYANSGLSDYSGALKSDLSPLMPVYHPDGNYAGQGGYTNPIAVLKEGGKALGQINDLWISGALRLTPIDGLVINADYTWNYYTRQGKRHVRNFKEYTAVPGTEQVYPWTNPNGVYLGNSNDSYHAINAFAEYTKSFVEKHNMKVMLGYNFELKENMGHYTGRKNLVNNDIPALNMAYGDQLMDSNESSWAVQGLFGRLNYDYMGKYLLELNGRLDGSSKFPKNGRYAFFPSFSAAWRISEEAFWGDLKSWWDDMKIRVSYGSLGNQNVSGDFPYLATYGINTSYPILFDGKRPVAVSAPGLVSPFFTWETVNQINAGFDALFLNNRLVATVDIYRRDTKNMLTQGRPLPSVLGNAVPRENAADLKTTGWELSLSWRDQLSNGFAYHVRGVLSDNQSEITKFDNPQKLLGRHYVGEKLGEIWGFESDGLFQSEAEVKSHADQSALCSQAWGPGDIKYNDLDGDKKVNFGDNTVEKPGDRRIIGNSTPRYSFGITAGCDWKGVDFEFFIQGIGKRTFMPGGPSFWGFTDEWQTPLTTSLDYWTPENKGAYFPRPHLSSSWGGSRQTSTRYLQNAAYARLKNVTLGYTLPKQVNEFLGTRNVRLYIQGENLFTITPMIKAFDPEVLNNMVYPINKKVAIGLNLTL